MEVLIFFTAVMESVLPRAELPTLLGMPHDEKETQLQELKGTVAGIRVYNWKTGHGGKGIQNSIRWI